MAQTKVHQYEAMFLLPPSASADLDGALGLVRSIVERHAGQVLVLKKWDERRLAYEIDKQKRGLYILCYFSGPGSAIAAIERDVALSTDVLRVLLTRADHLNQEEMEAVEPQPVERERPRDDRGAPRDDRPERAPRARREEQPAEQSAE